MHFLGLLGVNLNKIDTKLKHIKRKKKTMWIPCELILVFCFDEIRWNRAEAFENSKNLKKFLIG